MRLSYGAKMFSIAVLLVTLMACVTGASIVLVDRIETRLTTLADSHIPVLEQLAEIEASALQQQLALERARLYQELVGADPGRLQAELAAFEAHGADLDATIGAARLRIAAATGRKQPTHVMVELVRIDAGLERVEAEHQEWEGHVYAMLRAPEANPGVESILEDQAEDYTEAIDALRVLMAGYTESAAVQARADEARLHRIDLTLTALAAVLGLLLSALMTAGLVRPVRALLAGMRSVQSGALDTALHHRSSDEMGQLTEGFNTMVRELQVKEQIKEAFGRFVDPRIVRDLIEHPEAMDRAGRRQEMTILFSDIKGFTAISEQLTPDGLVRMLNAYLSEMSAPIQRENGVIDKFIGDAILAYWGEPFVPSQEQALRACRAAIAKRDLIEPFGRALPEILGLRTGVPSIDLRIGIATGPVIVGAIGSEASRNYTVIGDTVNIGARLEAACKIYGVRTLVDATTAESIGEEITVRELDMLQLVGKQRPVRVFQLLGLHGSVTATKMALKARYEAGLAAYRAQDWDAAAADFTECLALAPGDGPAAEMLRRVAALREHPPGADWSGVWTQRKK